MKARVEIHGIGYQAYVRVWNQVYTATIHQSPMMGAGEARKLALMYDRWLTQIIAEYPSHMLSDEHTARLFRRKERLNDVAERVCCALHCDVDIECETALMAMLLREDEWIESRRKFLKKNVEDWHSTMESLKQISEDMIPFAIHMAMISVDEDGIQQRRQQDPDKIRRAVLAAQVAYEDQKFKLRMLDNHARKITDLIQEVGSV
jgi:hypothetical protein